MGYAIEYGPEVDPPYEDWDWAEETFQPHNAPGSRLKRHTERDRIQRLIARKHRGPKRIPPRILPKVEEVPPTQLPVEILHEIAPEAIFTPTRLL